MANRYWVGGSGNWDATTTHWSATSGGAGGASAPTSTDSVFFDQAGTYTVTFGGGTVNCLNFSNTAGTVTFTGATAGQTFACYGNFTLLAGALFSNAGYIYFYNNTASSTNTVTTNGVSLTPGSGYFVNFSTGTATSTVVLGSALTVPGYIYAQGSGIWDTGGFAVTAQQVYTASGTPTLNLNNSTITVSVYSVQFATTTTLNAGTSTINHTSTTFTSSMVLGGVAGSSYTFYNISFVAGAAPCTFSSNITCNNLTVGSPTTAIRNMRLGGSLTVNGTFSGSGSSVNSRVAYVSSVVGTARTMTVPVANTTISNADFRDITAGNAIVVVNGGDCGGNTSITGFAAGKTVYWNLAGAQNWSATGWALTSGGTPLAANFPLAQDTAVFNNTGSVTGTITIDYPWNIGTVNTSARTTAMTLTLNILRVPYIHGSWLNGTGVTLSGTGTITFAGRGLQQVSGNGVSFTQYIDVQTVGGVQLTSALTTTGGAIFTLTTGGLDLNGNTLTLSGYFGTNAGTKSLTFNGGTLVCTASTTSAFFNANPTGFTTIAGTGTGTISMTGATAKTFVGGGSTFNCTLNQGSAGALTITGANTFKTITNTTQPATITFPSSTTTTFLNNFQLSGTSGNLITINSSTSGTRATISLSSGTVNVSYCSIKDIAATGGAVWDSFTTNGCVDGGNNTGWVFSPGVTVNPTGQSGTGSVGIGTVVAQANAPPTGPPASGSIGTVTINRTANKVVSGVSASGSIGTVTVNRTANVIVSGVSASGSIGSTTTAIDANAVTSGVSASGVIGTASTNLTANITVSGVSASGSIGTALAGIYTLVNTMGVSASGSIGSTTATVDANTATSGVSASGAIGSVSASINANVVVSGVSASGSIGSATTDIDVNTTISGVSASGSVGSASISATANTATSGVSTSGSIGSAAGTVNISANPTGISASGAIGSATTAAAANPSVTGVSASGGIGTITVSAAANDNVSGVSASGAIGSAAATVSHIVPVTGVSASGSIGTVRVSGSSQAIVIGVQAVGFISTPLVWGIINENQMPSWQGISEGQTPSWSQITESQTPSWAVVSESQTPTWVQVNDGNTVTWVEIPT